MLRIFLRVMEVNLHIRQPVIVEINIRKQQKTITMPNKFPMVNGKSDMNTSYEFHMTEKNPSFHICIVLCLNNKKKLAGWKEMNLRNIKKQQTVQIEDHLSNCPDKNSTIKFQVMYVSSPFNFLTLELISEQEIQQMNTMIQISQIEQQRRIAQGQTKILQQEYKKLIEQNKTLYKEIENIEEEELFTQNSWKKQLEIQENKLNQNLMKLQDQKNKMAQILDLVLQSGDSALIEMFQQKLQEINSPKNEEIDQQSQSYS